MNISLCSSLFRSPSKTLCFYLLHYLNSSQFRPSEGIRKLSDYTTAKLLLVNDSEPIVCDDNS